MKGDPFARLKGNNCFKTYNFIIKFSKSEMCKWSIYIVSLGVSDCCLTATQQFFSYFIAVIIDKQINIRK